MFWVFKVCIGGQAEHVSAVNAFGQLASHWVGSRGSQSLHHGFRYDQATPGMRIQKQSPESIFKAKQNRIHGNSYKEITFAYRYIEILARRPFSLLLFADASVLYLT